MAASTLARMHLSSIELRRRALPGPRLALSIISVLPARHMRQVQPAWKPLWLDCERLAMRMAPSLLFVQSKRLYASACFANTTLKQDKAVLSS